ncbi:hypothetical protein HY251_20785 [bacterium]|nr:hypothetical protein [bacterium]
MNRTSWIALVLAALVSGTALGTRAAAQSSDPPRLLRYEYKVFAMAYGDFKEKDDYKAILERAEGNELRADGDFKAYVLDYLAQEGWELVQVVTPKNDLTVFYLKRVKLPGQPPSEIEGSGGPLPGPDKKPRHPRDK